MLKENQPEAYMQPTNFVEKYQTFLTQKEELDKAAFIDIKPINEVPNPANLSVPSYLFHMVFDVLRNLDSKTDLEYETLRVKLMAIDLYCPNYKKGIIIVASSISIFAYSVFFYPSNAASSLR
jgi:hypothetical protein